MTKPFIKFIMYYELQRILWSSKLKTTRDFLNAKGEAIKYVMDNTVYTYAEAEAITSTIEPPKGQEV